MNNQPGFGFGCMYKFNSKICDIESCTSKALNKFYSGIIKTKEKLIYRHHHIRPKYRKILWDGKVM